MAGHLTWRIARKTTGMYIAPATPHTAGLGGASLLATGFETLATIVATTTLFMAGLAVAKLLPRRR